MNPHNKGYHTVPLDLNLDFSIRFLPDDLPVLGVHFTDQEGKSLDLQLLADSDMLHALADKLKTFCG